MSTNTLLRVEGAAWSVAGKIEESLQGKTSSSEIVKSLGLDYTCSAHNMKTDIEEPVEGYYAIYRDDTNKFLGPVKTSNPVIIQNEETFQSIEPLLETQVLRPVIADSYMGGKQFWGCFEYVHNFEVLGDEFKQYFIIANNHLKPDGNITVINTPVRIACMNAMSYALKRANLKFRIPAIVESDNKDSIAKTIMDAFERTVNGMRATADKLVAMPVSRDNIDKILDELFPYIEDTSEGTNHDRANATVDAQRDAFVNCLNADNLANFQGTMYQVLNALTDYTTHYYRNAEKGFNLEHRMTLLPGMNPEATTEALRVSKFINNLKQFEAIAR